MILYIIYYILNIKYYTLSYNIIFIYYWIVSRETSVSKLTILILYIIYHIFYVLYYVSYIIHYILCIYRRGKHFSSTPFCSSSSWASSTGANLTNIDNNHCTVDQNNYNLQTLHFIMITFLHVLSLQMLIFLCLFFQKPLVPPICTTLIVTFRSKESIINANICFGYFIFSQARENEDEKEL